MQPKFPSHGVNSLEGTYPFNISSFVVGLITHQKRRAGNRPQRVERTLAERKIVVSYRLAKTEVRLV